jgi:hypothetical protein
MRTSLLLLLALCVVFTSAPVTAQTSASVGAVRNHIEGIDIAPVPNAPFTAKVAVTWDQPLVGGGTVSRKYFTSVARDSQGRVRREIRGFVPADSSAEPSLRSFTIIDPVAGTRTVCKKASMSCATSTFHPGTAGAEDANNAASGKTGKVTRESLGEQTMDDLPVVGTRETVTNVAGSHGSGRLALTRTEMWYSPDLSMNLSVIRVNPQMGRVTLQVQDLVRGEPDPSWLTVPAGYDFSGAGNQ